MLICRQTRRGLMASRPESGRSLSSMAASGDQASWTRLHRPVPKPRRGAAVLDGQVQGPPRQLSGRPRRLRHLGAGDGWASAMQPPAQPGVTTKTPASSDSAERQETASALPVEQDLRERLTVHTQTRDRARGTFIDTARTCGEIRAVAIWHGQPLPGSPPKPVTAVLNMDF